VLFCFTLKNREISTENSPNLSMKCSIRNYGLFYGKSELFLSKTFIKFKEEKREKSKSVTNLFAIKNAMNVLF